MSLKHRLRRAQAAPKVQGPYPQSPFRYPGAKRKYLDVLLRPYLPHVAKASEFVDVFVGGGSVLLGFLYSFPAVSRVVANDKDEAISAFWSVITDYESSEELAHMLERAEPSVELHDGCRECIYDVDPIERAFCALALNRMSFSGIITAGPIGGREQRSKWGVGCRYVGRKLADQVRSLHRLYGERLVATECDFEAVIGAATSTSLLYVDPPYYVKGNQLYRCGMSESDHVRLASVLRKTEAFWVLSYDRDDFIQSLYEGWSNVTTMSVAYSISGEGRDSWVDDSEYVISPCR